MIILRKSFFQHFISKYDRLFYAVVISVHTVMYNFRSNSLVKYKQKIFSENYWPLFYATIWTIVTLSSWSGELGTQIVLRFFNISFNENLVANQIRNSTPLILCLFWMLTNPINTPLWIVSKYSRYATFSDFFLPPAMLFLILSQNFQTRDDPNPDLWTVVLIRQDSVNF